MTTYYTDSVTGLRTAEPDMIKKKDIVRPKKGTSKRGRGSRSTSSNSDPVSDFFSNIFNDGSAAENRASAKNQRQLEPKATNKRDVDAAAKVLSSRSSSAAQRKRAQEVLAVVSQSRKNDKRQTQKGRLPATATAAASGKGAMGPAGPDTPRKDAKRKADANAVALWNATIEENKRIAEEERKNNNNGNGGSGTPPYVPSNFDLMGQQAMDRINPIYDSLEARNKLLNSQRTTMSNEQQSQFAAEAAQRYAQMQQAMGTGYQDDATKGSGELQLQALQNAGLQQDQYSRRMQEMNSMNALDNTNAIAQARAAQGSNIWSSVAESRMAEAVAAQEAAAKRAASSSSASGNGAFGPGSFNYAQDMATANQPSPYANAISNSSFRNNQPRLQEMLQRLRGGANPAVLRAGTNAGQGQMRKYLDIVTPLYNQPRRPGLEEIMGYQGAVYTGRGSKKMGY